MTEIDPDMIASMNRDLARLAIDPARREPVRIEVQQLAAAIETVRGRVTFDSEPADFVADFVTEAKAADHG